VAMTKRLAWLMVCSGLTACSASSKRTSAFEDVAVEPRRPNLPAIVALMPDSPSARATYDGIVEELAEEYDVLPRFIEEDAPTSAIAGIFAADRPSAVVLMNNPTVRLYRKFQRESSAAERRVPAVAVLTSFLRESSGGIDNLTGIVYEVPLVTSMVNLRALLDQPVKKVGVLHRASFAAFVEEQRRLCKAEGFEVVSLEVSGDNRAEIRNGLRRLREDKAVDAIWVLNDNVLLDRDLLLRGWLPGLRGNKTPVVVNVSTLVSERVDFGTFAVVPDHRALGTQAAQILLGVAESNWRVPSGSFEFPLSVQKVLDIGFARENLRVTERELATIDRLVQ
jgi:hypothetical protein